MHWIHFGQCMAASPHWSNCVPKFTKNGTHVLALEKDYKLNWRTQKWDKKWHWTTPNTTKRLPEVTKSTPKGYQIDAKTSPDHSNDAQGQKVWFFNEFLSILGYHFGTIFVPRSTKMLKTIRPKINAEKIPTIYPKIMQKPCPNDGQI